MACEPGEHVWVETFKGSGVWVCQVCGSHSTSPT
jgi:hypothetical protein